MRTRGRAGLMARRVLRPRNLRWALTGLAIACLAALGWSWGRAGIDKPAVSLGYALRDVVRVWTSDPDAGLVNFTWTTQPSGEVRITVQLHRQISAPVTVLVALECDTRLGQFTVDDSNHAVVQSGTAGDDNRGCDEGSTQSAFLARPVQLLQVRFDGPEDNWDYIALEGRTVSPWSDEAAGERVAYTPYVWLGGPFPGTAPPMGDLIDASIVPLVPDVAVVDTNLAGRPSEIVESYFPTDTPLAIFGSKCGGHRRDRDSSDARRSASPMDGFLGGQCAAVSRHRLSALCPHHGGRALVRLIRLGASTVPPPPSRSVPGNRRICGDRRTLRLGPFRGSPPGQAIAETPT